MERWLPAAVITWRHSSRRRRVLCSGVTSGVLVSKTSRVVAVLTKRLKWRNSGSAGALVTAAVADSPTSCRYLRQSRSSRRCSTMYGSGPAPTTLTFSVLSVPAAGVAPSRAAPWYLTSSASSEPSWSLSTGPSSSSSAWPAWALVPPPLIRDAGRGRWHGLRSVRLTVPAVSPCMGTPAGVARRSTLRPGAAAITFMSPSLPYMYALSTCSRCSSL